MKWIEYAFKHFGPRIMPVRVGKDKHKELADNIKKAAIAITKVEKAQKILEEAKKNNNGLIF